MERLGPGVVVAVVALAALRAAAQEVPFVPEEASLRVPQHGPIGSERFTYLGAFSITAVLVSGAFLLGGAAAFVSMEHAVARIAGTLCLATALAATGTIGLEQAVLLPARLPQFEPLVTAGVILAAAGWWLRRVADRRLERELQLLLTGAATSHDGDPSSTR